MDHVRIAFPCLRLACGVALAAALLGADCSPPPVSIQAPREAQLIDDTLVVVTGRVARALDETSATLVVDGVDLLDALGAVPPFANLSGVVSIGGTPVQVTQFSWIESPGSFDDVSLRLTGLPAEPHLLQLSAVDAGMVLRTASRNFSVAEPLGLALESWDAGGLAAGAQTLSLGKAASASLGAGFAGGVVPLAGGGSLREGLPAAASALEEAP